MAHKGWVYRAIMFFVHPLLTLVWPARVRGVEHLPPRCALIISNHQSYLDIPLVAKAAAPRHVTFVARDSLARSRVMAFIIRSCGAVLIDRERRDLGALREAAAHLQAGRLVLIFPEATRTEDGSLRPFRRGALLPARKAGVPLVPCAIRGSYAAWPRRRRLPRPRRLEITFAAPIDPAAEDAMERVRAAILELVDPGEAGPAESPPAR